MIIAQRGYEIGLIPQLMQGDMFPEAVACAQALTQRSPTAFRETKHFFRAFTQVVFDAGKPQAAMARFRK